MLHEAALVTARLARALADLGLGLQDAHPWNILFDSTRGKWIDLGSICPIQSVSSSWIHEFRRHVVVPLALHSLGWHGMADSVTSTHQVTGAKAAWDTRLLRAV